MNRKIILTILLFSFSTIFSQKLENKKVSKKGNITYYKKGKKTRKRGCYNPSSIILENIVNCDSSVVKSNAAVNIVSSIIIPFAIKNINKLVYKPEKYIKDSSAELKLFNLDSIIDINNYENKKISYLNMCHLKDSTYSSNMELNFSLNKAKGNLGNKYCILNFDSYIFKYTNVKLTKKHDKVNIMISIDVNYFNPNGQPYTYSLKPIEIEKEIPKGDQSKLVCLKKMKKEVFRYIPTVNQIKSIVININEVNSRKKVWDKWLEIYNEKKDDLKDKVIEKIKGENDE